MTNKDKNLSRHSDRYLWAVTWSKEANYELTKKMKLRNWNFNCVFFLHKIWKEIIDSAFYKENNLSKNISWCTLIFKTKRQSYKTGMIWIFCSWANFQQKNNTAGRNKFFFVCLVCLLSCSNLLEGPQKIFGGSHAARGPQFGHVCYKTFRRLFRRVTW
jgi:hypothetical protein